MDSIQSRYEKHLRIVSRSANSFFLPRFSADGQPKCVYNWLNLFFFLSFSLALFFRLDFCRPLEDAVSKWQFKLRATDSANESVVESLDITVQQHKSYRSVNHEIIIAVNLLTEFASNVDWEMHLIKGIVDILGDTSTSSVLVRDIRYGIQDPNAATFIYTNESLPKDVCPEMQLNEITAKLTPTTLSNAVSPQMSIKSIEGKTIGTCSKPETVKPTAPKPTPHMMKNYPPIARNQVDRVNATINQLLVFKVPSVSVEHFTHRHERNSHFATKRL